MNQAEPSISHPRTYLLLMVASLALQSCTSSESESTAGSVQALETDSGASDSGTPDTGPDTSGCPSGANIIIGTSGSDTLTGTAGDDCILGLGGDDTIDSLGGDDYVFGGEGEDTVHGGDGNDWLYGDAGDDILFGEAGEDVLIGGDDNDHADGGDGVDNVGGDAGDDTLIGGGGADYIQGNDGCDIIRAGGGGYNHIVGGAGNDVIEGGTTPYLIEGGDGDDWIAFASGTPIIDGGAGVDACVGTSCENAAPAYCSPGCGASELCVADLSVATAYCGSACTPSGDDSTCDGVDNDCDSTIDEAYAASSTTCGVGVCATTGTLECAAGATNDTCTPGSATGADTGCDGVDNDCDGTADEGFVGAATSCGLGVCAASGTTSCASGSTVDSCSPGSSTGPDSVCDGVDSDCDGSVDEAFASIATTCGVGACATTGATTCSGGIAGDSCTPGSGAGDDSTCDGVDDDCDGSVDEGYVSIATSCGVGVCGAGGATSCVAGVLQDSCSPGTPTGTDTVCDGLDDDCDGVADESFVGTLTSCGEGVCAAAGSTACMGGAILDTCSPGAANGDDSLCDGQDNDCDASVDESFVPTATSCGSGACGATGSLTCQGGILADSCSPAAGQSDNNCDNVDDDCDGNVDEGYVDGNACTTDTCTAGVPGSTPIYGTALCPADPSSSAPADTGPRFWDNIGFLADAGGTQRDNLPGAIEAERAAHLFGSVEGANAGGTVPLGGVRISVRGHDDIGVTYSRADGSFNLLVNGGGVYTLRFEAGRYTEVGPEYSTESSPHQKEFVAEGRPIGWRNSTAHLPAPQHRRL